MTSHVARSMPALTAALLGSLLAGCGADTGGGAADMAVVRDSAGITIVEFPLTDSAAAEWREAEEILSIGAVEGPPAELLSRVTGAVRLDDGGIVIADGGSNEIRWFDADGQHTVSVGRSGAGPGEFRRVSRLARAAGDSVLAYDVANRRITVLTPDGTVARMVDVAVDGAAPLALLGVLRDGRWLVERTRYDRQDRPGEPLTQVRSTSLLLWDGHEPPQLVRTDVSDPQPVIVIDGVIMAEMPHPLAPPPVRIAAGDVWLDAWQHPAVLRIHGVDGASPEIGANGDDNPAAGNPAAGGEPQRIISMGARRVPFQDAHLEAWFDGAGYSTQQRAAFRSTLDQLQAPEFLPTHGSVLGGRDGQVWVSDFPDPTTRAADWTVYSMGPDGGTARWRVRLPPHFNALSAGDGHIVGVLRDEWGVETVRVYRLR